MLDNIKKFVVSHKKGIAITTGTAAVAVIGYKLWKGMDVSTEVQTLAGAAETVGASANVMAEAASVYQP